MIRPSPSARHLVARVLRRTSPIYQDATRTWAFTEDEVFENPPPICIPGQVEKATRHLAGWRRHANLERFQKPEITVPASHVCVLQGAVLQDGALYSRSGRLEFWKTHRPAFERSKAREIDKAVLVSSALGYRWFGHWLFDTLPLALMAREIVEEDSSVKFLSAGDGADPFGQKAHYRSILKLEDQTFEKVRINELFVLRRHYLFHSRKVAALRAMREKTRTALCAEVGGPQGGGKRIYLRRGKTGAARVMVNEDKVCDRLSSHNFEIVDAEVDLKTLASHLTQADVVVGPEGSQLAHVHLTMRGGGVLIGLEPPFSIDAIHKMRATSVGLRWGFLVGDPVGKGSYAIDLDDLDRTLELVL